MPNSVVLIPARSGSKGIINKNLKKINGYSLVALSIIFAKKLNFVSKIFVSTDSEDIKIEAKKFGSEIFHRPKYLSGDRVSDIEIINHFLHSNKEFINKFEYLIYLQPTSPFRKLFEIKKAMEMLNKKSYSSCWSVIKVDKKYHPLKSLIFKKNGLCLFDKKGKKIIARQQLENAFIRNGMFYIFNIKDLLRYKSIYVPKIFPYIINKNKSINIDDYKDLNFARKNKSLISYL